MSLPTIARCDVCKGPANWCLDKAGDVWYRCLDASCEFFVQLELFTEEPIWEERVYASRERVVSTDPTQDSVPRASLEGLLPF